MLAGKASILLTFPLVIAAMLSQFSVAVADTLGGFGNMMEVTKSHIDLKHAIVLICGGAMFYASLPLSPSSH